MEPRSCGRNSKRISICPYWRMSCAIVGGLVAKKHIYERHHSEQNLQRATTDFRDNVEKRSVPPTHLLTIRDSIVMVGLSHQFTLCHVRDSIVIVGLYLQLHERDSIVTVGYLVLSRELYNVFR